LVHLVTIAEAPTQGAGIGYLRHVEACNRFDPDHYLPFLVGVRRVGFIRRDRVPLLAGFPDVFEIDDRAIRLAPALDTVPFRNAKLAAIERSLLQSGVIASIRGEAFAITEGWLGPLLFELDRGAVPFFGTRSYGVHLNGYRRDGDRLLLWIGTRALDKRVAPGKLDNLVAGGISAGYDAATTLIKEAAEEAGMPEKLARRARSAGAIRYRMEVPEGLRDDVLFGYDLEVAADFVPRNTDGEISSFQLMSLAECLDRVRETDDFKFNVNLVLIDFALRHGAITPEDAGYLELVSGLRGGLVRESGQDTDLGG
jgi:8-oxo-dGTP pyrophosphatase MutT (NUDIX family)